ncbi:MAG: asparagine synthetase B family protein [Gammaproteobacteria bacterium]|nr:asparagine synthetase B family protein [Gammaproteobacteria bacterium]
MLAVVDAAGSGVTVVRDRLGGRVAYWGRLEHLVAVSDRAEIVAEVVGSRTEENPRFLAHFFALKGGAPVGQSAFRGVNELVPGGCLTIDGRVLKRTESHFPSRRRWRFPPQWIEAFYEAFRTAVSDAVGGHESIAVMLSGGMDSAPIMAVAREILEQQYRRPVAVSWAFPGYPASDESRWIIEASDFARVERRMFRADEFLPFSSLGADLVSPGSPALNPFRLTINACYHSAAAAGCSVVLNGSRGDLLYSNYPYLLYDLIRRRDFPNLWRELGGLIARNGLRNTMHNPMARYAVSRLLGRTPREPPAPEWLTPWACSHLDANQLWPPESNDYPFPRYAATLLGSPMSYGPAQENEFAQRIGIERREPFQSSRLIRLMLEAPVLMSHNRQLSKWIMTQAMDGRLPASVRLKPRTGRLDEIYKKGFMDSREKDTTCPTRVSIRFNGSLHQNARACRGGVG